MKKIIVFIFLLNITESFIYAQSEMLLFGPTLHYNIGGGEKKLVFGLELSYWKMGMFSLTPPTIGQGVDIGVEFDGTKTRIYSELQLGTIFGVSAGYVCQFGNQYEYSGYQYSAWGAFFGGIELRYRKLNNIEYFAPGGILKFPVFKNVEDISMPGGNINFM